MTSAPTWTTSPTTRPRCSPPCKPPPPGLLGCPSWEGRRCARGGTPDSWRLAPYPPSCRRGMGAPCDLQTLSSPKAPQNRSRTSGNVTTSATEAWCRTTLPAVSDLVCGEWVRGRGPWRLEDRNKTGNKCYPSAFYYSSLGVVPALSWTTPFTSVFSLGASVSGISIGDAC